MVDLTDFYTDTHDGDARMERPSVAEVEALARETWGDPESVYEFREVVAVGGMGAVLRVWDAAAEREVAMKVMLTPDAPDRVERFLREARLTAALEHPGIVAVHDVGLSPHGDPYFTMTLLDGGALHRKIADWAAGAAVPTLVERMRIVRQVSRAVAYAHSRGALHLDVKPQNVVVGRFDEVLLVDWGMARLEDDVDAPDPAVDGVVRGTPGYMAPEQARGETAKVGRAADVYALGAVAYSLATLKPPIVGSSVGELLDHSRSGSVVPAHRRGAVPVLLSRVIARAMDPDPDRRYPSAAAFADDLAAWASGHVPAGVPCSPMLRATAFWQRHRLVANLAVAGVCAVAVASGLVVTRLRLARDAAGADRRAAVDAEQVALRQLQLTQQARLQAEDARRQAERSTYAAELRVAQQYVDDGRVGDARDALARCADGLREWEWRYLSARVEQVAERSLSFGRVVDAAPLRSSVAVIGESGVWRWNPKDDARTELRVGGSFRRVRASADQSQLLLYNVAGQYALCSVDDGRVVWQSKAGPVGCDDAVPLMDGQHLIVAKGDGMFVFDMPAQRIVARLGGAFGSVRTLAAMNDGRRILAGGDDGAVALWDVAGRRVVRRYDVGVGPISEMALDPQRQRLAVAGAGGSVALLDLATGRAMPLRPASGAVAGLRFSPSADALAILAVDGDAEVWDVARLRMVASCRLTAGDPPASIMWIGRDVATLDRRGNWRQWSPFVELHRQFSVEAGNGEAPLCASVSGAVGVISIGDSMHVLSGRGDRQVGEVRLPSAALAVGAVSDGAIVVSRDGGCRRVTEATGAIRQLGTFAQPLVAAAVLGDGRAVVGVTQEGVCMLAKLSSVPFREDDVETLAKLRQGGRWMSVDGGVVGLFEERTAAIGFDGQIRDLPPLAFGADAVVAARIGQDGLQVLGRVDDDLVAYNLSLDAGASWRVVGRFSGVDVVAAAYQGSARIVTARRDGVIEVADLTGTRLLSLPERLPNVVDVAAGGGGIVAHAEGGRISAWLTPDRQ